ncbi:putative dirigent protein [Helianthus annuus]|nr:putative dirigent protein [Helianthus annuus]
MAKYFLNLLFPLLFILSKTFSTAEGDTFLKSVNRNPLKPRISNFRFYGHIIFGGPNATVVNVVPPRVNVKKRSYGLVNMMDIPLTKTPESGSKLLGRVQGIDGRAWHEKLVQLMAMNIVFFTKKYNGSTLTLLGRNPMSDEVREMPVVGGSGLFRFARGYLQASTYSVDFQTRDNVIEYIVHVFHY